MSVSKSTSTGEDTWLTAEENSPPRKSHSGQSNSKNRDLGLHVLDLSFAPRLRKLDCSANKLTRLHPGVFPAMLEQLLCYGNQLSELDLSGASSLIRLRCEHNQLSELDLAIRFDRMIREGKVDSQTTLAALAHVTQPRMNQILSLNYLTPDIQEAILHLPRTQPSETAVHEKALRSICAEDCWKTQREMWNQLVGVPASGS